MKYFLPKLIALITRHPRYMPEIEWASGAWIYNIFRLYELIFGRRHGVQLEAVTAVSLYKGRTTTVRYFFTLEAVLVHCESAVRKMLKENFSFEFVPIAVFQPVYAPAEFARPGLGNYLFAVAFNTYTSASATSGSTATSSHTASGSDRLGMAHVYVERSGADISSTISSASWGGNAMTQQESGSSGSLTGSGVRAQVKYFSYIAPAASAQNVVGTNSTNVGSAGEPDRIGVIAFSWSGCDQTSPYVEGSIIGDSNATKQNSAAPTRSNSAVYGEVIWSGFDMSYTGSGTVLNSGDPIDSMGFAVKAAYKTGVSTSVTHSWSFSFGDGNSALVGAYALNSTEVDPNINVFDALTITESVILTLIFNVNTSDSLSIAENIEMTFVNVIDVSDSIIISESVVVENPQLGGISVNDTLTITESVTISNPQLGDISVSESIALTESVVQEVNSFISVAETISLSEDVGLTSVYNLSVSDSLTLTDTVVGVIRVDPRSGIAHMRSLGNSRPLGMDPRVDYQMKSNQQNRPLGMDDNTML